MGNNEGWPQSKGLLPNGLLPNVAARVTQKLDTERWSKAEERTAELIACIQPNQPSEERRNAVANYVQQLIMKCFSCQVFTFGSVPLKTYLPDGDIDLTAFSKNQNLKNTWANDVRDMLENEEKRENAEFHVKEVQYIQAEVKIIKCLVENIVVDISFNQLGGLCTLCFLEEVDQLINQNHLFKRSIILIKAWCYYESRILGAHHGLISTYALETLVLYIFHVFNNSFSGPLEVLYRFLEFFSNFDWENFCVSFWGPVPINQLPDMRAEPPRKDGGDLLLSKRFLDACGAIYAVYPGVQENQGQPFVSKHFNVIDPLRTNNNLGRSVSKGNFFRIRSAFAFGAKKLSRLLECPKENLIAEVNQFFMNTWDRHSSRHRPDAPSPELGLLKPPNMESKDESNNFINQLRTKRKGATDGLVQISSVSISNGSSNIHNALSEYVPKTSNVSGVHHSLSQKNYGNQVVTAHKTHKVLRTYYFLDNQESQATHQFMRTRSSPELTKTSTESATRGQQINKAVDTGKNHQTNARTEYHNRRQNLPSGTLTAHQVLHASSDDPSVFRHPSQPGSGISSAPNLPDAFNRYANDNSEVAQDLIQEQQDFVNMMASASAHGFPGPISLPSSHIPVSPILGYTQRNLGGLMPRSLSLIDPAWGSGMQFPPGLVSSPLSHYLSGLHLASNPEQMGSSSENSDLTESNQANSDASLWAENDHVSSGSLESASPSRSDGSIGNSLRGQSQKLPQNSNDAYASDKSTNTRVFTVNELNLSKLPKSAKEKRGRKTISGGLPATPEKSKTGWQYETDVSAVVDEADDKDWHMKSRHGGSVSAMHPSLPVGYEAGSSGSDPMIPGPMVVGSGFQQITFYPTGPPVPFVTMLPLYNFSHDAGNSSGSPRQFDRDDSFLENGQTSLSEQSIVTSNFDTGESQEQSEVFRNPSFMDLPAMEPRNELNVDILHSDFTSHWQNLQYGRICQSPHSHPPIIYSPVPPVYLHGHFPWDGPGRPSAAANMGFFTQVMGYGPRILPVTPLHPGPSRTAGVQHYGEELPRYRGGTGTYLPNPKPVSFRDRQAANNQSHRGGNNYDRNDHGDTDRGWNINSKPRGSG